MEEQVTIVGAGLCGSLLAVYLARRGLTVQLFERLPDMRSEPVPAGRSINLALAQRGLHALHEVGLESVITPLLIPMRGRMIHEPGQAPILQRYGNDQSEVIYSISRVELNRALLDAAESTGRVHLHFKQRCIDVDLDPEILNPFGILLLRGNLRMLGCQIRFSRNDRPRDSVLTDRFLSDCYDRCG